MIQFTNIYVGVIVIITAVRITIETIVLLLVVLIYNN